LRREIGVVAWGVAGGVLFGTLVYLLVRQIPFDLSPAAPSLVAMSAVFVLFVGAGACFVPLRRVLRIDPARALRSE
jgi:ABC-type antimicrobial peptide transport system permease subunit